MPLLTELGKPLVLILQRFHAYGVAETSCVRQRRPFEKRLIYGIAEEFCLTPFVPARKTKYRRFEDLAGWKLLALKRNKLATTQRSGRLQPFQG